VKVLSKGSGTRAVAAVLACAALQVAAQAQGPGETLTGVEARAARLGHAAEVVITAVSDGDTATAVIEGRPLRLRLARIDAPEHRQAWGQRAEQSLRQLVWKKQVHIEWREVDRNGRPIVTMTVDGLDVSGVLPAGDGLLRGKFFAGRAAERSPFVGPLNWDLHGSPLVGGHVDYLAGPWQIRASHTRIRFEHELPLNDLVGFDLLSAVPALVMKDTWTRFDALGLVYDAGPIQFQGMVSRIGYETLSYEDARAGYLIASYRLPRTTPYLGYSRVRSSAGHAGAGLPAPLGALVTDLVSSSHSNQHTVFLGVRWDVQPNLALKAQLDLVRGSPSSVFPVREPDRHWNGRLNVFSLAMDFVF